MDCNWKTALEYRPSSAEVAGIEEREREGEQKGGRRQRDEGFVRWINSGIKMAK